MNSRRRFIAGTATAGGAALVLAYSWNAGVLFRRDLPSGLGSSMDQLMGQLRGARRLGEQLDSKRTGFLQLKNAEIAAELKIRLGSDMLELDTVQLSQRLSSRINADFEAKASSADRLTLDGWQLSRTEALVALLAFRCLGAKEKEALPAPSEQTFVELIAWDPKQTFQGSAPNIQSDGHSGFWFRFKEAPKPWYVVSFDGVRQPTYFKDTVITTGIHDELQQRLVSTPGRYAIVLHDDMNRRWQHLADFVVNEPPERFTRPDGSKSTNFCAVELWGPQLARIGIIENPQPDGSMGIYVRTGCAPKDARLRFNGIALATSVQTSIVTAPLPIEHLQKPGIFPLTLGSSLSDEEILIGNIELRAE